MYQVIEKLLLADCHYLAYRIEMIIGQKQVFFI